MFEIGRTLYSSTNDRRPTGSNNLSRGFDGRDVIEKSPSSDDHAVFCTARRRVRPKSSARGGGAASRRERADGRVYNGTRAGSREPASVDSRLFVESFSVFSRSSVDAGKTRVSTRLRFHGVVENTIRVSVARFDFV